MEDRKGEALLFNSVHCSSSSPPPPSSVELLPGGANERRRLSSRKTPPDSVSSSFLLLGAMSYDSGVRTKRATCMSHYITGVVFVGWCGAITHHHEIYFI
ncbi:hypothetical protein NL676_017693 [Syzygium grande]|nr:hypothetical protein NL676_017693 [Syzygium grande]